MGANKTPIDKTMTKEKAIKQGGYYNTDGDWNNIIVLDDYPGKILRGRVETLILKDGKLFMFQKNNNTYRIPGGGFDKGVLNIDQAYIETKEEAKILIDNIRYSGVNYVHLYEEIWKKSDNEIPYDGTYNEVYIADFKDYYHGYIRKGLSDMELTNKGEFYDLDEVKDILKEPHKQALQNILNGVVIEETENELYSSAVFLQVILNDLHKRFNKFTCVNNVDIESDDGGYVFAQYNIMHPEEKKQVKDFIQYCVYCIKNHMIVEEPISYGNYGFLSIKYKSNISESIDYPIIIEESNIFKKDKVYNLDDFIDNKSNILLITGISGSGKTTLSEELSNEYNAELITLDFFQNYDIAKEHFKDDITTKLLQEYFNKNKKYNDAILSNLWVEGYDQYFRPFFFWLLNKLKNDKSRKYIIEGMHIILFTKFSEVKDYPLICLETGKVKSLVRHWIRDEWTFKDVLKNGYKDYKLFSDWNKSKKQFFKEASTNTNEDKYPVFIVNTYTGTAFGKIIKSYTHSQYTHSAISLDTSLENLYSFNGDNGTNKLGGFSKESLSSYINYNKDCKVQVNCIFVNKNDLYIIKNRLDYLQNNQKFTKYGYNNLLNIILNKSKEMGQDATSMVCSQFVSYILRQANIQLLDKSVNLVTPKDLSTIANPKVYLLYEGLGREYDKKKIDRIFRKLKIKSHLVKEN